MFQASIIVDPLAWAMGAVVELFIVFTSFLIDRPLLSRTLLHLQICLPHILEHDIRYCSIHHRSCNLLDPCGCEDTNINSNIPMKEQSAFRSGPAECNEAASFKRIYNSPREQSHPQAPYYERCSSTAHDPEPPLEFSEFINEDEFDDTANTNHQYNFPNLGTERSFSEQPRHAATPPNFAGRNDKVFLRGVEQYAEVSGPDCRNLERRSGDVPSVYNLQRPLANVPSGSSPPMPTPPYFNTRTAPRPAVRSQSTARYEPFGGRFLDPASASAFRKAATRFDRKPYLPPEKDNTIEEIDQNREYHVERIYNAMTHGNAARDNGGSIAMKRWVHGAYYDSDLVEAYAHKVFDCLLLQAKDGFRGWQHNDYVADDRKGEDEDRDATCAERLDNIIRALGEEKTICEDVMNSACQIRMFVNAPKAYANRKFQNRVGNSKRGQPKGAADTNERPSKVRKPNPKPVTRARTGSGLLQSRNPRYFDETPRTPPQQRPQPYYASPQTQSSGSPVVPGLPSTAAGPRHTPAMNAPQAPPYARNQPNPMSPRSAQHPYFARMTSMPPAQHSPYLSPPSLSVGPSSAPVTPETVNPAPNPVGVSLYGDIDSFGSPIYSGIPIDGSLFDESFTWSTANQTCAPVDASLFSQSLDPALLSPSQQHNDLGPSSDFPQFWSRQQGVQQLPQQQGSNNHNPNQPQPD